MDFDAWKVDLKTKSAFHQTGFRITVEGNPRYPAGVIPTHFPDGLSAVEQARLLRCGLKAIVDAARDEHSRSFGVARDQQGA